MNFRKNFVCVCAVLALCSLAFAKPTTKAPSWFGPGNTLYQIYPRADYMAFRGEGDTEEAAKADGIAKIANNISATITDRRSTETSTLELITGTDVSVSENTLTSTATVIESQVDLFGLEQSEVYYDKKAKRYYCVSYIDIANATRRFRPQIEDAKTTFYSSYNKALAEEDAILSCSYYKSAAVAGAKFLEKLSFAYGFNPDIERDYQADRAKVLDIPSVVQKKIQESTLHLVIKGDYGAIISTAVSECFNELGFIVDSNSGVYNLNVTVSDNEVIEKDGSDTYYAVYPSVLITLVNKNGNTVYRYEAKEGKTVSLTDLNTSRKKAYPKLGNAIKQNLASDFNAKVGR